VPHLVSIDPVSFGEVLITEYPIGSVINWRCDAPPFDLIAGLSLLSDCTFRFRPYDKAMQKRKSIKPVPPNDVLYMLLEEWRVLIGNIVFLQ
jgi:alkylated DNA repair dioxygenase AlkB